MAGGDTRVPLLLRTAQTLRERFAALRSVGPIEAVMEEFPRDQRPAVPPSERSLPWPPNSAGLIRAAGPNGGGIPNRLPPYLDSGRPLTCGPLSGICDVPDKSGYRSIWRSCEFELWRKFLRVAADAGGFVPLVRRKYGLPEKVGTTKPDTRWLWTVFELAEARPPFTTLSLGIEGGVFRVTESGALVSEWVLKEDEEGGPRFASMFERFTFHPQRYWHLPDLIEASIAVMDMVEIALPSLADEPEEKPPADGEKAAAVGGGDEEPEDTTKSDRGRRRRLSRGLTLDQTLVALAIEDPSRKSWSASRWEKIVPWGKRAIQQCDTYRVFQTISADENEAEADKAEKELASLRAEDEDGHGFHRSATKSAVGRQDQTAEDLAHEREVAAILAKGKRAKKRTK